MGPDEKIKSGESIAVLLVAVTDTEMLLVVEPPEELEELRRITGIKYLVAHEKWPGGHVNVGETPRQAARREAREEAGLRLKGKKKIFLLEAIEMPEHTKFVFGVRLKKFPKLPSHGQNGEKVLIIKLSELGRRVNFHPRHREIAERLADKHTEGQDN